DSQLGSREERYHSFGNFIRDGTNIDLNTGYGSSSLVFRDRQSVNPFFSSSASWKSLCEIIGVFLSKLS
ncbi:hypothetical protein, partial [Afipia sp. OHSU_I-C4]|uniref:hypothetical protein n=1 Tax=Afipia sp. OHSU_I-C4 TaxID=1297863 RepID=UPI00195533AF